MSKTILYLGYFCLYSLVLLIIGKSSLRDGSTPEDYFICERKVGVAQSVCTFTGTWVSAITILSLTGSVYEDGLAVLFYSVIPWFLGAFLLALVARRLYDNGIITIPELFRTRYGSKALQGVYAAVIILVYVFYLVSQYKGFGMISAALFNIPYPVGVGMVYLFILYTTFGGYRSVVRTDVFNLVLLVVGLVVLMGSVVSRVGGLGQLYRQAGQLTCYSAARLTAGRAPLLVPFSERYTPVISLSMFWGWGLGLAANPQYLVRMLGASSGRDARRTVLYSLVLLFAIYFALVHIGLGMRTLVPELAQPVDTDGIIIQLINNELLAKGLSRRELSASRVVNLGRLAVLGGGTLAMLLTLNPPDFTLSYGGDVWGLLGILLFPPLYGTLLTNRLTRRGVWACIITGGASIAVLYPLYYRGAFTAHPAMFGVPLAAGAMVLVSAWDRKREGEDHEVAG